MEEQNSHSLLVEIQNGTATLQDSLPVHYKVKHILTISSSNHIPWYLFKGVEKHIHAKPAHGCRFINSINNNCQNLEGTKMFFSKWVGKLWYTQTVEYYSVLKIYKLPSHKKTWRNLKYILLSERSQSEKVTYDVFQIIWCYRKDKTMETIKILVVSRA